MKKMLQSFGVRLGIALVLLNSVASLCAWVSEGFYSGVALVDFSKSFARGVKSGEICFFYSKLRKQPFSLKFLNSCPPSDTHACV